MATLMNEKDFESPGYEYLRSYQSMSNLYFKLVALNYQKDFCAYYKCPQIHRLYFSTPAKNQAEQQFLFSCLCAWLIKDKCQMNLNLEPQEYEDPDNTIEVILEALRLLLSSTSETNQQRATCEGLHTHAASIGFPPSRLKQAFGPEVIWTMNVLADRALELLFESRSYTGKVKIMYNNKGGGSLQEANNRQASITSIADATSITIGQPVVGGGLTTRPLGSYQIDDSALMFDCGDGVENMSFVDEINDNSSSARKLMLNNDGSAISGGNNLVDPDDWYRQVERARSYLDSVDVALGERNRMEGWQDQRAQVIGFSRDVDGFLKQSKPLLETISGRVDRQLHLIDEREKSIRSNIETQLKAFSVTWREYSKLEGQNNELVAKINEKADKFEDYNTNIRHTKEKIELRMNELNDGSKLRELEKSIHTLNEENNAFRIKIGLLLTVYGKLYAKLTENIY